MAAEVGTEGTAYGDAVKAEAIAKKAEEWAVGVVVEERFEDEDVVGGEEEVVEIGDVVSVARLKERPTEAVEVGDGGNGDGMQAYGRGGQRSVSRTECLGWTRCRKPRYLTIGS